MSVNQALGLFTMALYKNLYGILLDLFKWDMEIIELFRICVEKCEEFSLCNCHSYMLKEGFQKHSQYNTLFSKIHSHKYITNRIVIPSY